MREIWVKEFLESSPYCCEVKLTRSHYTHFSKMERHPSIVFCWSGAGSRSQQPPSKPPPAYLRKQQGQRRPAKRWNLSDVSWGNPEASSQWDMPGTPCPGGILVRHLSHLSWLLLKWMNSGSTVSPAQMAKLLTLSLREVFWEISFPPRVSMISFFRSLPRACDHIWA